jgi:hypothetical protein
VTGTPAAEVAIDVRSVPDLLGERHPQLAERERRRHGARWDRARGWAVAADLRKGAA